MTDSIRLVLHELIAALDRRVPRPGHPAEPDIAQASAELRTRAAEQIAAIEDELPSDGRR